MRRFPAHRGLVVVLLASGSLVACSSGDPSSPPTTMHPGTAATSTATSSGDPTEVAGAAAIAAVQTLYDDLNFSLRSGSTTRYLSRFTKACVACISNANTIDLLIRDHKRFEGGQFYVSNLTVVLNRADLLVVQGRLRSDPLVVRAGNKVSARDNGAKLTAFAWHVSPSHGVFLITDVQALK
jgi:hypothetical protein